MLPSRKVATGVVRSRGTTTLNHEPHPPASEKLRYELAQKGSAIYTDAAGNFDGALGTIKRVTVIFLFKQFIRCPIRITSREPSGAFRRKKFPDGEHCHSRSQTIQDALMQLSTVSKEGIVSRYIVKSRYQTET